MVNDSVKYSENVNTGDIFNAVMAEEKSATSKHHWTNENDADRVCPPWEQMTNNSRLDR